MTTVGMRSPESLGRMAARLPTEEQARFKESVYKSEEEQLRGKRDSLEIKMQRLDQKEKKKLGEISANGNLSEGMVYDNLLRSWFMGVLLAVSLVGEYLLARWTIAPFGLGSTETALIAITIMCISMEAMNLYLTSLRKRYPELENHLFLVLGCLGVILIFLIAFFGADIRRHLFHTTSVMNSASLNDTVNLADGFYRQTSSNFIWLMISLTAAITIIGGVTYHDLRNRLFTSIRLHNLHKELKEIQRQMEAYGEEMIIQDTTLLRFKTDFETSLLREKIRMAEEKNPAPTIKVEQPVKPIKPPDERFGKIIVFPIALIIIALCIFLFSRGLARGETIALFDLSISSEAKGYSGPDTEFTKNVKGMEDLVQNNLKEGENIKAYGVTERSFSSPFHLLEGRISPNKGAFGEIAARDKLNLLNQWKKLSLKPVAGGTDLFGAMQLAEVLFSNSAGKERRLIVFSDMRQYGGGFDFETPQVIDVDTMFNKVLGKGLVANLAEVKVWCLGVHGSGKSPAYWKSLKEFWTRYFKQAGVSEVKAFTMERRMTP